MRVLVTGASGFVGRAVVAQLALDANVVVRAASRGSPAGNATAIEHVCSPELSRQSDWRNALHQTTAVVHAAARVHMMHETSADPLTSFREVNVDGTARLAEQAAAAGVRRFVFLSSIKVNGERTAPDVPFNAEQPPAPSDAYGLSKWEAELALRAIGERTGMEVAIVRPVLVYGPGVGANFRRLMRALDAGVPLPLGAIPNRRSLVAIDNLTSLISVLLVHPRAAGGTFLISDGHDMSTSELLRRVAHALGRIPRLLPVPPGLLRSLAGLTSQHELAGRLLDSLQVDITATRARLDWKPTVTVDTALEATVRHYRAHRSA